VLACALATAPPAGAGGPRAWPDTSRGVHVFNDQLASNLSAGQARFAARRYAGTQKQTRSQARRLRAIRPGFLVLHYRLGIGLGYRATERGCDPTGEPIRIVEGERWIEEWPADVDLEWFYPVRGRRALHCPWGWYLADVASPAWRAWWPREVLRQVQANEDDGVFMDSTSVPNYFGASTWDPRLPDVDEGFERDWTARIDGWLAFLQSQPLGRYALIPNVGSWITTRDRTTYAAADGVMIEGFALPGDGQAYAAADWALQVERVLGLVRRGKVLIGQAYARRPRGRLFALATYLLVKGRRSFLNLEAGMQPEWWPEYDVPVGRPRRGPARGARALYDPRADVYRRTFANGEALANPSGATRVVRLERARWLAVPHGGGAVPASGRPSGRLAWRRVRRVVLPPASGAVLVARRSRTPRD
jgi:hypothetical protein